MPNPIHQILDFQMRRRARIIARLLSPHLAGSRTILDLGCGTGHNAEALRALGHWEIIEADVTDMKRVGPPPVLFSGLPLPFPDDAFDSVLLIHMLHYVPDLPALLAELRRVSRGPALIVHTIHHSVLGRPLHVVQEFIMGRGALKLSRAVGYVPKASGQALNPATMFNLEQLQAGLTLNGGSITRTLKSSAVSWPFGDWLLEWNPLNHGISVSN